MTKGRLGWIALLAVPLLASSACSSDSLGDARKELCAFQKNDDSGSTGLLLDKAEEVGDRVADMEPDGQRDREFLAVLAQLRAALAVLNDPAQHQQNWDVLGPARTALTAHCMGLPLTSPSPTVVTPAPGG